MKKFIPFLLILLAGLGVAAGGYYLGQRIFLSPPDLPDIQYLAKRIDKKDGIFYGINPHIGPLEKFYDADILQDGALFYSSLPVKISEQLKVNDPALLLDDSGKALNNPATIMAITFMPDDPAMAKASLLLPASVLALPPSTARFIIDKKSAAKRLPLSALQTSSDGSHFVWLISPFSDGDGKGSLTKKTIVPGLFSDTFFDAGHTIRTSDIILENPKSTLREGDTISFSAKDFQASFRSSIEEAQFKKLEAMRKHNNTVHDEVLESATCPVPPDLEKVLARKSNPLPAQDPQ